MARRGSVFDITIQGMEPTLLKLRRAHKAMINTRPVFELAEKRLETGEDRLFGRLKGRYVQTGDLKRSLTEAHANGAIRRIHRDELVFGSSLPYAIYQSHGGKNQVLKLLPKERAEIAAAFLSHITKANLA